MPVCDKAELRKLVRAACPAAETIAVESAALCAHVAAHVWWQQAQVAGAYVPLRREADVTPLLHEAWQNGKTLALPRVLGDGAMVFHQVGGMHDLIPGAYGILEPKAELPLVAPEQLELLIVPLEAIDHSGMRLGKGGGYYDRLLPRVHCPAIGAVLSHQWVPAVPHEMWDRPLNAAVDHNGIHLFNQERND